MSTRANIIIKDSMMTQYFYRHSDGYPEGVKDTLETLCKWYNTGKLRRNVMQSSGWLIILGAMEHDDKWYRYRPERKTLRRINPARTTDYLPWKVGSYEITDGIHGDVEYIYTIDLDVQGEVKYTIKEV